MIVSSTLTAFRHHPLQKTRWWWYVLIPFHQRPSCHYHPASYDFCWIISNVFVTNDCLCNVTFGLDRRAAVWCGPELYEHMAPNISPNRPWSLPRVTCAPSLYSPQPSLGARHRCLMHIGCWQAPDNAGARVCVSWTSDTEDQVQSSSLGHDESSVFWSHGCIDCQVMLLVTIWWLSNESPDQYHQHRAPVTRQSEINKLRDNLIIVTTTVLRPTGRSCTRI